MPQGWAVGTTEGVKHLAYALTVSLGMGSEERFCHRNWNVHEAAPVQKERDLHPNVHPRSNPTAQIKTGEGSLQVHRRRPQSIAAVHQHVGLDGAAIESAATQWQTRDALKERLQE